MLERRGRVHVDHCSDLYCVAPAEAVCEVCDLGKDSESGIELQMRKKLTGNMPTKLQRRAE